MPGIFKVASHARRHVCGAVTSNFSQPAGKSHNGVDLPQAQLQRQIE